jgi:hypothetical protein
MSPRVQRDSNPPIPNSIKTTTIKWPNPINGLYSLPTTHVYDIDERFIPLPHADSPTFYIPPSPRNDRVLLTHNTRLFSLSLSLTKINRRCGFAGKSIAFRPDINGLLSFPVIVEGTDLLQILHF